VACPPVPPLLRPPELTGHLLSGLTTVHAEGVSTEPVFLRCDQLDHLTPDALRRLDAHPPLTACGSHNLAGH
jgi:hypothetical protein